MKGYTYSQARQNLAQLLNNARDEGEVRIKRRDGQTFILKPVEEKTLRLMSPVFPRI